MGDPDGRTGDPLTVLRMSAGPDADAVIRELAGRGRKLAIVSNNSEAAVREHLALHSLNSCVSAISARMLGNPLLMKPNLHLLQQVLAALAVPAVCAVFVVDSVTDVDASVCGWRALRRLCQQTRKDPTPCGGRRSQGD